MNDVIGFVVTNCDHFSIADSIVRKMKIDEALDNILSNIGKFRHPHLVNFEKLQVSMAAVRDEMKSGAVVALEVLHTQFFKVVMYGMYRTEGNEGGALRITVLPNGLVMFTRFDRTTNALRCRLRRVVHTLNGDCHE